MIGVFTCDSSDREISTVIANRVGLLIIYSFPVISENILNVILADFWRHTFDLDVFDSNVFLVQLSFIFWSVPAFFLSSQIPIV